jgi:hypothetical protein
MGSIKKVAIFRGGRSLTVAPHEREADAGDEIVFRNITHEPVTVLIPDGGLFGEAGTYQLEPGGSSPVLKVAAAASGGYPYAVYSVGTREFAQSAVPIIIIYPR